MKRLLFSVLAALVCLTAAAQQRIRGKVTDSDGKPIANVLVQAKESGLSALTDIEGRYLMPIVKQRKVTYLFSREGYESREIEVSGQTAGEVSTSLKKLEPQTLYVVDGRIATKEEVDALKPETIANMNVMKGIDHAVIITTHKTENEEPVPFLLMEPESVQELHQTSSITIRKRGAEVDGAQEKSLRIMKNDSEVVLDDSSDVMVIVANLDGTFRIGSPAILKQVNSAEIQFIEVLREDRAAELIQKHNLKVKVPQGGVIFVRLGELKLLKTYPAKMVE